MSRKVGFLALLAWLAPLVASANVEAPHELVMKVGKLVEDHGRAPRALFQTKHADARSALQSCENAERSGYGVIEACTDAQKKVALCNEFVETWQRDRISTLQQVDAWAQSVGQVVGQEYSDASPLRGLGKQRDRAMLFSDAVFYLRNNEKISGCPAYVTTNPPRTAEQVLAEARDGKAPKRSSRETTGPDPNALFQRSATDMQREADDPSAREARLRRQAEQDAAAREAQNRIVATGAQRKAMAYNAVSNAATALANARTAPAVSPASSSTAMPGSTSAPPVNGSCMANCTGRYCPCICAGIDDSYCDERRSGSAPTTQLPQSAPSSSTVQQPVTQYGAVNSPSAPPAVQSHHEHNPANVGNDCVIVRDRESDYGRDFVNKCPWRVVLTWPGGLWHLGPGGSYPVTGVAPGADFKYAACKDEIDKPDGMYQNDQMRAANMVSCHD